MQIALSLKAGGKEENNMADVTDYKVYKNKNLEVLTDEGFKDFRGIIVGNNPNKLKLTFVNGVHLICTPKHKLIINNQFKWEYAKDLEVGAILFGGIELVNIEHLKNNDLVYELLHVDSNHRYLSNNILSGQCLILDELAFVANEIVNEFWESVMPIISSSPNSQIFIVSTPNGTQNKFYDIYTKAERGESDWTAIRVDWWHVPGRTETWKKRMIQDLGSVDRFNQEFGNQFIEVGQSPFKKEVFDFLREGARGVLPVQAYVDTHGGFEPQDKADEFTTFKIFQAPSKDRVYVVGVDVSDGVGRAASVAVVLDITDLREIHIVAIYHNRRVAPVVFATKLNIIGLLYGTPNMLVERNNVGGQVVDELYNVHHYTRLVNYSPTNDKMKYYDKLGVYSHTNSKYQGVTNMRYWFDELMCVHVPDIATIQEFEIFVRSAQGTWSHQPGEHNFDDRVMATTWGLFILDRKIAEQYLTVVAYDETGRPLKVEDPGSAFNELDFDQQMSRFSMFGKNVESPMSTYFGPASQNSVQQEEVGDYLEQGWTFA